MSASAASSTARAQDPIASLTDVLNARSASQSAAQRDSGHIREVAAILLRDMRHMKGARFNAQERLDAKHKISVVMFALAGVAEVSLSIFAQWYQDKLDPGLLGFVGFAGVVTAMLLLVLGLVVGFLDYQSQAFHHQRCALDLSNLTRELEIDLPDVDYAKLQDYRRRYHETVARCPFNHAPVDIERAWTRHDDKAARRALDRRQLINIYGLYALGLIAYASFWLTYLFIAAS